MNTIDSVSYMDRRLKGDSAGVSAVYSGGSTTWTLPYSVAVDGSEGDLRVTLIDTAILLTCTRPAANQVSVAGADYSHRPVYIGVLYPFTYVPTTLYLRDKQGEADMTGQLSLHRVKVLFHETTDASVVAKRTGRPKQTISKTLPRAQRASITVPIHAKSKDTRIEITSTTPGARALTGLVWQGEWQTSYRRV